MEKKLKWFGLLGVIGAVIFMVGDCLIYVYPERNLELNVDPIYAQMPLWRFHATVWCGVIGMAFLLFGFYSLYAMAKELCPRWMQIVTLLSGAGVAGTAFAHFNLGALLPYTYKAILICDGNVEIAADVCNLLDRWTSAIDTAIICLFYLQLLVLFYMILSGKSGLPRWYILISPIGAVLIGILWRLILNGHTIAGAWGACESIGEGLMYLLVYLYWRKECKRAKRY